MTLVDIINQDIKHSVLERVVTNQGEIPPDTRAALFKSAGQPWIEIVQKIVDGYGTRTSILARGLYDQIRGQDTETATLLLPHFQSAPEARLSHQASLVARVPTIPLRDLYAFLDRVQRQVCLIVSSRGNEPAVCGTGFLISRDLVLTCHHVLKAFPPNAPYDDGGDIELYFDFWEGLPVDRLRPNLPGARMVRLANPWHVTGRDDTNPDGMLDGDLTQADIERLTKSLDFALLKLAEPVGLQPVEAGGGRRRGWVQLPDVTVPQSLAPDDWIIIPQHPNGAPQRIDLGRYQQADKTGTRIRYNTNTAQGTSGAPCFSFNQKFVLVGLHNAYVGPAANPLANQAIRFDHIATLVATHAAAAPDETVLRWSVSRPSEKPRVILGRRELLDWLRRSMSPQTTRLADRVYAAYATRPKAGCTFSNEILHAEIREIKIPRAVYGHAGQQLPGSAEDFVLSLLRELGIDPSQYPNEPAMPVRPGIRAPGGATGALPAEVDKLDRWLSDELPGWVGRIITQHLEKEIDVKAAAIALVQAYKDQNIEPPDDLKARAASPDAIKVRAASWEIAYVVIDDLRAAGYSAGGPSAPLTGEVASLVAALVKGKPESAMHPGLKRLRWMFLGDLPEFIAAAGADGNGATVERLDPAAIGIAEFGELTARLQDANILSDDNPKLQSADFAASALVALANQGSTEARLETLQNGANAMLTVLGV